MLQSAAEANSWRSLLSTELQQMLSRFGFDESAFESLRRRLQQGAVAEDFNALRGRLVPPSSHDVDEFPPTGSNAELCVVGERALRTGHVGVVVLAGGMATRFGGAVKGVVEALPGKSFLELKLASVDRLGTRLGVQIPVYLMTSFATDQVIRDHVEQLSLPQCRIRVFAQNISLRLCADGSLFRDQHGALSPYAPGHGDLSFCLRNSGLLNEFRQNGGQLLQVSNVDNLAATLDPAIIGSHVQSARAMTVELVTKEPGDKGGAPAWFEDKLQIIEAFRFPSNFDQESIPVFNTNSFVFDAAELDQDFALDWFMARKNVNNAEAVQFERLVGQVSAFLTTHYLRVPRTGANSRFLPVKDPDELRRRQKEIQTVCDR